MSRRTLTKSECFERFPFERCSDCSNVPYNPLLDQGYRSIGDVHSTAPPDPNAKSDASDRSGRWAGKNKTECGLHSNYFEMKKKFESKAAGETSA